MPTHTLTIPDWRPVLLNELMHVHWSKRARLVRADYTLMAAHAREQEIPKATTRGRVSVRLVQAPTDRLCDPDAPLKALLDGLRACGLLVNDSPKWLELGDVAFERGEAGATIITLEDLEG